MNIGICGGTFDPFHCGHLEPILAARASLRWDRVIYIPAFIQPFKQDRATASPFHRFAMAVLGTEDHQELHVSPRELERGSVSYTVDTLQELRAEYPDATIDWIIGDDNLEKLLEWKSLDTIFTLANFAVLTRSGATAAEPALSGVEVAADALPGGLGGRRSTARARSTHGSIVFAENAMVPVSSTEIRRRIGEGESIDDLVPPRVSHYIHHYGLYREGQT